MARNSPLMMHQQVRLGSVAVWHGHLARATGASAGRRRYESMPPLLTSLREGSRSLF